MTIDLDALPVSDEAWWEKDRQWWDKGHDMFARDYWKTRLPIPAKAAHKRRFAR